MSGNMDQDEGPKKLILNIPIDYTSAQLSEQVKALRLARDTENLLKSQAIVIFGPNPNNSLVQMAEVGSIGNDLTGPSDTALLTKAVEYVYNMATNHIERQRTPSVFISVPGNTNTATVWTPPGGKKFRLMGFTLCLTKEAACAGALVFQILDGATAIWSVCVSSVALVATGQVETWTVNLPANGYLSILADNTLSVSCGALTAGNWGISLWGNTE